MTEIMTERGGFWLDAKLMDRAITPVGMNPNLHLTRTDLVTLAAGVRNVESALRWMRADIAKAMKEKEAEGEDTLDILAQITGMTRSTLQVERWTAEFWPYAERNPNVSFSHHQMITKFVLDFTWDELKEWLELAAEENLSVIRLEAEIMDVLSTRKELPPRSTAETWWQPFGVTVHKGQYELTFEYRGRAITYSLAWDTQDGKPSWVETIKGV